MCLLIALFCFVITPMQIKGDSMMDTYMDGQIVMVDRVNKSYNYLDIVVFKNDNIKSIKRIVGIPGDVMEIKEGILYRNGKQLVNSLDNVNIFNTVIYLEVDQFYVAGDNFIVSRDSRHFGPIKKSQIIGKII